jgi:hypothetical protein
LTSVAAVLAVAVLALVFWGRLGAPAYALEQTIEANQQLRSLHIRDFYAAHSEPKEFWLACDETGQIRRARWYMPAWDAPEDGAKVIVWSADTLRIWFQKGALTTFAHENPPLWLLDLARKSDPRLSVADLKDQQVRGEVALDIQEPTDKAQPIVVTATYPPQSRSPGRRTLLRIDQATKLVTRMEGFVLANGQYVFDYREEFSDYNVPIDPALFDLETTVPANVRRVDGDAMENAGLPQDSLSDDEIATEVVRQFFEAMIAGDYEKAGQLYSATPAGKIKQFWGQTRFLRIVSIDKPTPHPDPKVGGLRVPCKIEIEKDGVQSVWEPYGPFVRTIHRVSSHPRWEIHGGL